MLIAWPCQLLCFGAAKLSFVVTHLVVQGIKKSFDYKKILKALKKEYCCNGTVVEDDELGQVIQVQGDQRKNIADFLTIVRFSSSFSRLARQPLTSLESDVICVLFHLALLLVLASITCRELPDDLQCGLGRIVLCPHRWTVCRTRL
jgi:Translation initiation factor SUI1